MIVFWMNYKNSTLATFMSVISSLCGMFGVIFAIAAWSYEEIPVFVVGIILILVCVVGQIWAYRINKDKTFQIQMETEGMDRRICSSDADVMAIYNTCPGKRMLRYIRSLNPDAADQIEQNLAAQKKQKK